MNEEVEEQEEQNTQEAASEQSDVEPQDQEEQKMVPLAALKAERKKRQEGEARALEAEAKAKLYQEYLMRAKEEKQEPEEPEDPSALVETQQLKQTVDATKREILETLYQDLNPKAVQEINKYLKPILEKKPWLAQSIDTAPNRFARAAEIVNDYMHLVEEKTLTRKSPTTDGQRIVQNAGKPRSPVEIGKSAQPSGTEYLKSIQGKKEFREYRQKVLRGEA